MTHPARLSLAAPHGHALAEGVRLAFEARGLDLTHVAVQDADDIRLTLRRGAEAPVVLRDTTAMLELSEDLHPDQPLHPRDPVRRSEHRQGLAQLAAMSRLLGQLIRTNDQRDVDLDAHLLRSQLGKLAGIQSRGGTSHSFSLLDLASVPLLWRIDALDRTFETHLLTGYEALRDRQDWLTRHPQLSQVLTGAVLADWLQTVSALGGLITRVEAQPDWSTALGPSDRPALPGKDLPLKAPKTKVHSIGSEGRIR